MSIKKGKVNGCQKRYVCTFFSEAELKTCAFYSRKFKTIYVDTCESLFVCQCMNKKAREVADKEFVI